MALVQILGNHRAVGQSHLIVDQDGNPPQWAEAAEFIIALERNDRVNAIGHPLNVAHRHHLAHIGRHRAADDRRWFAHDLISSHPWVSCWGQTFADVRATSNPRRPPVEHAGSASVL